VKVITDPACTSYRSPGHPERPERISATVTKLRAQSELAITFEPPGPVSDAELLRAHTPEHLERLKQSLDFDADTPYLPNIRERALASAGAGLRALELARAGETAFSLMRPPGHHATREQAMGFCYLSNIAIAALAALNSGFKRVAVYDFDVHHGNGTEAVLLNVPGAAFFSIHQFPCYPGTGESDVGDNCFNFPVPPQTPRGEYRKVFERAFKQMQSFKPDLVAVSAGFDAYARDPLAQETLEAEDYYWVGQKFRGLELPVFSLLEGGYSDDLPELIFAYLRGVAGK
jgi:acetoin utilization deacetylase AcuC-like enzyme